MTSSLRLDTAFTLRPPTPDFDALPSSPCFMAQSRSPSPMPPTPSAAPSTPRSHVRRRRSSLSLNVSSINASLGQLKSPQRSVNTAMQRQRQLLVGMSPGRARRVTIGEVGMTEIKEEGNGRVRSGSLQAPSSLGGPVPVLRTRRKLRLPLAPALPAPTAPLPPIPSQPIFPSPNRQPFTSAYSPNAMRRPDSPLTLGSDFSDKLLNAMSMSQSPIEMERVQWEISMKEEEGMKEN